MCETLLYSNCSNIELRRFKILQVWANWLYTYGKPTFSGNSLVTYLDKITTKAQNYKPKNRMAPAGIQLSGGIISYWLSNYKQRSNNFYVVNRTNLLCFNSSSLRIDCEAVVSPQLISFTWFNFTFALSKNSNPKFLKLDINTANLGILTNK